MTTTCAPGARERIWAYSVASDPGSTVWALLVAVATADRQPESLASTQVDSTLTKPTSLPPTPIDTRSVLAVTALSWPLVTLAVVAPEHATKLNDTPGWAAAHSAGYALGLRRQLPLALS